MQDQIDEYEDIPSDQATIRVLAMTENSGKGRYLLELTGEKNIPDRLLLGITVNASGRITRFHDFTVDLSHYIDLIKLLAPQEQEVEVRICSILGSSEKMLYSIELKHSAITKQAVEFEVGVSVFHGSLDSLIQEPPGMPWQNEQHLR